MVEDLSKIFIEEMDTQGSSELYFFDPQILATGLVSVFKPAIENAIERGFDEFWEDEVETIESTAELKNNIESFEISYIKREGKIAKLVLEAEDPDSGEITKLEFKLNKTGNYWRITQISNLEDILKQNMDEIEGLIDLDM